MLHKREKLKQLRKAYGTQDAVGKAVGVTGTMIRYVENGNANPSVTLMLKLSCLFKTPSNELFPDIEEKAQADILASG